MSSPRHHVHFNGAPICRRVARAEAIITTPAAHAFSWLPPRDAAAAAMILERKCRDDDYRLLPSSYPGYYIATGTERRDTRAGVS